MAAMQNIISIKICEENRVFNHNSKIMTENITIFHMVWDIYPGNISAKILCNSTTENLSYWNFLAFVDIHCSEIMNTKRLKIQHQINIQFTYLSHILVLWGFFPVTKKYDCRNSLYY